MVGGTSLETKGGVASIINCWRDVGLFERWNVRYIGSNGAGSSLRGVWLALQCWLVCAWLMATARVRLVHVHHSSFVSFWRKTPVFALAMLLRKPLIVSLHGGAFREFYRDLPMPVQWWARLIMRRCRRYVVLTESWRDWARRIEPRSRVAVIPNLAPEIPAVPPPYPPKGRRDNCSSSAG